MTRIKPEPITRGIKNCRDSSLFKGCSPLQLLCNLTGNHPQSATFHTANVIAQCRKPEHQNNIKEKSKFATHIFLIIRSDIRIAKY
jgi:hypothetical protein